MCGIAGYVSRGGWADRQIVKRMCDQIRHRGPDDEGFYSDRECAIGMRRLSIIDLAGGHQPISNEDGPSRSSPPMARFTTSRSCAWTLMAPRDISSSPTATPKPWFTFTNRKASPVFLRLRGMFAYAIWDARQRRLLLVRDRFGKSRSIMRRSVRGFTLAANSSACAPPD